MIVEVVHARRYNFDRPPNRTISQNSIDVHWTFQSVEIKNLKMGHLPSKSPHSTRKVLTIY